MGKRCCSRQAQLTVVSRRGLIFPSVYVKEVICFRINSDKFSDGKTETEIKITKDFSITHKHFILGKGKESSL